MYPALIKRQMPHLTLTDFTAHMKIDGKRHSGFGFSCSRFDKDTHLCKDFANRPDMCRTYICRDAVDILALTVEPNEDLPW
jgi:Fe-S-cluster containining protein